MRSDPSLQQPAPCPHTVHAAATPAKPSAVPWRPIRAVNGEPAWTGALLRDEQAVADARHMVRNVLTRWRLEWLADDSALVMTELVANAVRHACGHVVRVTITLVHGSGVRVSVTDESMELPVVQPVDVLAESGRGLHLVEATAARWGAVPFTWGKQVWAEVTSR